MHVGLFLPVTCEARRQFRILSNCPVIGVGSYHNVVGWKMPTGATHQEDPLSFVYQVSGLRSQSDAWQGQGEAASSSRRCSSASSRWRSTSSSSPSAVPGLCRRFERGKSWQWMGCHLFFSISHPPKLVHLPVLVIVFVVCCCLLSLCIWLFVCCLVETKAFWIQRLFGFLNSVVVCLTHFC